MKTAAAIPSLRVADCAYNASRIAELAQQAAAGGAEAVVFPELSLTGYTCADLFLQPALIRAAEEELSRLAERTAGLATVIVAGAPVAAGGKLYNCALWLHRGKILGAVPKSFIPGYAEFYEPRWFASGRGLVGGTVTLCGQEVPFGCDVLFRINGVLCGAELCEDLWVPVPPSCLLVEAGVAVVFNLSASPEHAGKHIYLRTLVAQQSARTRTGYVYASAGFGESTTDVVFAGNALIAEQGTVLAEAERFSTEEQLLLADLDIEGIVADRLRTTTFPAGHTEGYRIVACDFTPAAGAFARKVDPTPFVPSDGTQRSERCEEVLSIQALGLARRLTHTGCSKVVVGISGGLDSTLALLVAVRAFDTLALDRRGIVGITMPGFGTTDRTHRNAVELMRLLGVTQREIPIGDACRQHFADIGLPEGDRSAAYENAQARERTQILMDVANIEGGLVVGTGDLSELALGWATYNGDQMSMYGVNASVPKTLVRHLVRHTADAEGPEIRAVLLDVLDTPVSPELLPADAEGAIAQRTEELVGPYELHDFFLYHFLRRGVRPATLLFLAERAFAGSYPREVILRWMRTFFRRFFTQQFKRSAMPDGPKAGSVALSPRGDWRMPSDASVEVWLREIDTLQNEQPNRT